MNEILNLVKENSDVFNPYELNNIKDLEVIKNTLGTIKMGLYSNIDMFIRINKFLLKIRNTFKKNESNMLLSYFELAFSFKIKLI